MGDDGAAAEDPSPAMVQLRRGSLRAALPLVERHTVSDSWAVNTYAACDIRCAYCITVAPGPSTPRAPAATIRQRLRDELAAVGTVDRLVVGPYVDVYPSPEAELGVTRAALEVLVERDLRFHLITKGPSVLRDADLLGGGRAVVQVSVNTVDEDAVARLEPGAATASARLDALHRLAGLGVDVRLQVAPWIPGVTDVAALAARVDPAIVIQTTPLRLPAYLDHFAARYGHTQASVNEAYRAEYERVGPLPNVRWSRPPALDGAPPHIVDNLGGRRPTDWSPAPSAPDPGQRRPFHVPRRRQRSTGTATSPDR